MNTGCMTLCLSHRPMAMATTALATLHPCTIKAKVLGDPTLDGGFRYKAAHPCTSVKLCWTDLWEWPMLADIYVGLFYSNVYQVGQTRCV